VASRNRRPRDALGRPLPYGSAGVDELPPNRQLAPDEALVQAQRLLDSGRPFQAHEVLEDAWKSAPPEQRDLWQGLAQIAVGVTHAARGNRVGARRLIERGADNIGAYVERPRFTVDVAGLLRWCAQACEHLADDRSDGSVPVPQLTSRPEPPEA
jgi:hypothetical protein